MLKEFDAIKVKRLLEENRYYDGTKDIKRAPQIGDSGIIVGILKGDDSHPVYIVENANKEGYTIWLADFEESEIEKVNHGEKNS